MLMKSLPFARLHEKPTPFRGVGEGLLRRFRVPLLPAGALWPTREAAMTSLVRYDAACRALAEAGGRSISRRIFATARSPCRLAR